MDNPFPEMNPYLVASWGLELEFFRAPFQERLPVIRVPLRETDKDVALDLQAVIDQCYRNGDYDADIDYDKEPEPRLSGEDARWADALLRKLGRRRRARAACGGNGRRRD